MVDLNVERHDGDEPAVCVGQWCCGCAVHPTGKPWGWNADAWVRHNETCANATPTDRNTGAQEDCHGQP